MVPGDDDDERTWMKWSQVMIFKSWMKWSQVICTSLDEMVPGEDGGCSWMKWSQVATMDSDRMIWFPVDGQ